MSNAILVLTTTAAQEDARQIARTLLQQKLAACVHIRGPIESSYWWQGQLEFAAEWQCIVKTRRDLYTKVEQAILAVHPYQTPEIVAIDIVAGSEAYLRWLNEEVQPEDKGPNS